MALVLDTGVLYAAVDEEDEDHARCVELLTEAEEQLVIPAAVLVELDYFIRKYGSVDAWQMFAEDVHHGAYAIFHLDAGVLLRAAKIQAQYADQPIGVVDASVVATCEALGEEKVATLDVRHFSVLRTSEGKALRLLPDAYG